ncbi:MAG: DUF4192 domain-containing protein [Candidatus Nanopelagicales bacterium]
MSISITSPQAAVAATPYLLGFAPRDSLVLLLLSGKGLSVSMRVDLPESPELGWLQSVLGGIPDPVPTGAVLIAFADSVAPDTAVMAGCWMSEVLSPILDVLDVMVVTDGRICSLLCESEECCPQDGIELESLRDHPIVAECVASGLTCLNRREDLVVRVLPVHDALSQAVVTELQNPSLLVGEYEHTRDLLESRAFDVLTAASDLTARDVACVAAACRDVHVRDPLLALLIAGERVAVPLSRLRTRLMYAVTHLPDDHAGPVAATLALVSWADGDGAAALVAADRAMELDQTNTLAPLVADALQHGLPPATWASLTKDIPMDVLRGH